VHARPAHEAGEPELPVLVPEGFAWGAFWFGPFWLAAHRAWVPAAVCLAVALLLAALLRGPAAPPVWLAWIIVQGLWGQDARRWSLGLRGYTLVHVIAARDADSALARLLAGRPDLVPAAAR
jgi:hypothetical protein